MRRVLHRLLSAAPAVAAAYLAVWATAFPARAAESYEALSRLLVTDRRYLWLCMAVITTYAALWWWTSIEPKSRRRRIQAGLRRHYEDLTRLQAAIIGAAGEEEYMAVVPELQTKLNEIVDWLSANMSVAAVEKFKHPTASTTAGVWVFENHRGRTAQERGNTASLNKARIEVLDTFLRYEGWDGERPGLIQRAKSRFGK